MKKITNKSIFHSSKEEIEQHEKHIQDRDTYPPFAFTDQAFLLRKELRPTRLQLELLRPELVLHDHDITETFVFFGGARQIDVEAAEQQYENAKQALAKQPNDSERQRQFHNAEHQLENSHYLKEARHLAEMVSRDKCLNFVVTTGGGPGFMKAANQGACDANASSIALTMMLPNEDRPNPYVTSELTFQFHYFAMRKMHFLMRAKAIATFPGGLGSLDELFEVLNLIKAKKMDPIPLLLFNQAFWKRIVNFQGLIDEGMMDASILDLIVYVETAEQAWEYVLKAYP